VIRAGLRAGHPTEEEHGPGLPVAENEQEWVIRDELGAVRPAPLDANPRATTVHSPSQKLRGEALPVAG
jgi:hypothetical protein